LVDRRPIGLISSLSSCPHRLHVFLLEFLIEFGRHDGDSAF
jgi:hypothetical protein